MTNSASALDEIENSLYIAMSEVFLYGVYTVMFGFYIHVLYTRGMGKNHVLPAATIVMFGLCTAHVVCLLASTVLYDRGFTKPDLLAYDTVSQATNAIYVTSNVVADGIFVRQRVDSVLVW
ncbi:hypothetical protein K438DRAFT_61216 [Mycena galopus ATCC 62051]|nr:hypothetical protein K438DRAFT_61216 [Mycena galopus ATCC 62051]